MKLLVKKSDKLEIPVYAYEETGNLNATHDKEDIPKEVQAEELTFVFRRPSYQDSTNILAVSQASATTIGEEVKVDAAKFQNHILRTLLTDWDLKDEEGEKIECSPGNISSLDPSVARAATAGVLMKIRL